MTINASSPHKLLDTDEKKWTLPDQTFISSASEGIVGHSECSSSVMSKNGAFLPSHSIGHVKIVDSIVRSRKNESVII